MLPNDVLVADVEGAVRMPATLLDEVLAAAVALQRLDGWIWVPMAFTGTLIGLRVQRHFGF